MTLATQHGGQRPWEEVWFLELHLPDGRGVWLRHTLSFGIHHQSGVWATWFERDGRARGWHRAAPPESAEHGPAVLFDREDARLTPQRATGACGALCWDLELIAGAAQHRHVPAILTRLGLGRTYEPAILDLRVRGHVVLDGDRVDVAGARGVLGHIFGGRNRVATWAWAHAPGFDGHPEVVFEALSARLGRADRPLPPLTTAVLTTRERTWRFSRLRDLVRTRSRFGGDVWHLRAIARDAQLRATMVLPAVTALAAYTDADGRPIWCRNSTLSRITVHLDHGRGTETFHTRHASAEIAARRDPGGRVTLP